MKHTPQLAHLVFASYGAESSLIFGEEIIASAEGIQQGDPLGPLLFCLTLHPILQLLRSDFKVFYMDDGTIGGNYEVVAEDLTRFEINAASLGLHLNRGKSEVICSSAVSTVSRAPFDVMKFVPANEALLLGAPIGDVVCIDQAIGGKIDFLKTMGSRLCHFRKHDALLLLRHALAIPKVLYLLRSSPCFLSPRL